MTSRQFCDMLKIWDSKTSFLIVYLKNGNMNKLFNMKADEACPKCNSSEIDEHDADYWREGLINEYQCLDCSTQWIVFYKYSHYIIEE